MYIADEGTVMGARSVRRVAFLAAILLLSALATANAAVASHGAGAYVHPSGITILTQPDPIVDQLTDAEGASLEAARRTASADPDNLSWPYIDRKTGTLVMTAVTSTGRATAAALIAGVVPARVMAARAKPGAPAMPALAVRVAGRSMMVQHSQRQLQAILDAVVGDGKVTAGVDVQDDYPDPEHNRVVLETNAAPDAFLYALAARYSPSAIAVRVVHRSKGMPADSRNFDGSPFWGGDLYYTSTASCTSGFEWLDSSNRYMISAGHCAVYNGGNGGNVYTALQDVGSFGGWTWATGVGTTSWGGTYYGDLSYTTLYSNVSNSPYIYRCGVNSSSLCNGKVVAMWSRSPANGDRYCTGGTTSGEQCGWITNTVGGNWEYSNGEVCRHCSWSYSSANKSQHGDSGGPVYTVDSNGNIYAKGIISGDSGLPFSVYSDIWDAWNAFPGWLLTG
jgi:hypothetical protein